MQTGKRAFRVEKYLDAEGETVIGLFGRLDHHTLGLALQDTTAAVDAESHLRVSIDLSGVEYMDSAGALAVHRLVMLVRQSGMQAAILNATRAQGSLIDLVDPADLNRPPLIPERRATSALSRLGAGLISVAGDIVDTFAFTGRILSAAVHSLVHPRRIRWEEVRAGIQRIGIDALPLIGLLSFLMGFIIGSMAVLQLRSLSMNTLIGAIVSVAIVQEFGPLIASLVAAGRSGSAFAAEIATMTVNEEVNAITAMGYDPLRFLAVPKLLAAMIAIPLVTFYADAAGVLGGLIVAHTQLGVSPRGYFVEIPRNVTAFSFVVATIKTFLFAFIVAVIGCHRGFRTRGGAEEVGKSTTSSVVTGIFLIIATDFIFAAAVPYLG